MMKSVCIRCHSRRVQNAAMKSSLAMAKTKAGQSEDLDDEDDSYPPARSGGGGGGGLFGGGGGGGGAGGGGGGGGGGMPDLSGLMVCRNALVLCYLC